MANIDAPAGFIPSHYADGRKWNGGGIMRFYKSATAGILGVGDPVIRIASTDAAGHPECQRATTGAAITGVIVGIELDTGDLSKHGHLASADVGYVHVCIDPAVIYKVQEGGAGTALAVAQIGKHIDSITAVDADTTRGLSKYKIDNNAVASDNTWRIEGQAETGDYPWWYVRANLHTEVNAGASNLAETA